jgi:hypothetical protein
VHLGAKITNDLTDVAEINGRMIKASQMFGVLRREMLASKDTWPEVKKRMLEGMTMPTMLDRAGHWVVGQINNAPGCGGGGGGEGGCSPIPRFCVSQTFLPIQVPGSYVIFQFFFKFEI